MLRLALCLAALALFAPTASAQSHDAFLDALRAGDYDAIERSQENLKRTYITMLSMVDCSLRVDPGVTLSDYGEAAGIFTARYPAVMTLAMMEMATHPIMWKVVGVIKASGCDSDWIQQTYANGYYLFTTRLQNDGWDPLQRVERPRRVERPDAQGGASAEPEAPPDGAEVFAIVEEQPELIGGLEALQAQLEIPESVRAAGIEGRVMVQFVVDADGVPRDVVVVRGLHRDADAAAVRLVEAARFTPGRQGGRAVPVRFALPITFRLR